MSRFVPAGSEEHPAPSDDAWAVARREVSSKGALKPEQPKLDENKSLYETLQANKAAKQAEFEESIRLKNQFRTLDEDEVDFLDSVLESVRAKEAATKKETEEQLEAFRRQREAAQKVDLDAAAHGQTHSTGSNDGIPWATKKRRKKELDSGVSKLRKTSSSAENKPAGVRPDEAAASSKPTEGTNHAEKEDTVQPSGGKESKSPLKEVPKAPAPSQASALGLSAYSSDED